MAVAPEWNRGHNRVHQYHPAPDDFFYVEGIHKIAKAWWHIRSGSGKSFFLIAPQQDTLHCWPL
jgi:hypothetical protein